MVYDETAMKREHRYDPDQPRDADGKFGSGGGGGGDDDSGGGAGGGGAGEESSFQRPTASVINGDKPGTSSGSNISRHDRDTGTCEEANFHAERAVGKARDQVDALQAQSKDNFYPSRDELAIQNAAQHLDEAEIAQDEIDLSSPRTTEYNYEKFEEAHAGVAKAAKRLESSTDPKIQAVGKSLTKIADNMPRGVSEDDDRSAKWVSTGVESRRLAFTRTEWRAIGDGNTITGYAAVFDSPSEPLPYIEYVRRGAFTKTLDDGADVRLLIDHEGVPLARTKSGTLSLAEDERGLYVEAELDPANPDAARVLSAMKRGDLSQMSFAFKAVKDSWSGDRQTRELKEVRLYDVSIVTFPAYEEAVAELRSRNETTMVEPQKSLLIRKNQIALAKIKRKGN